MSLLPCITFANPNVQLYGQGGGGGGGSNGPIITVSSLIIQDREIWGQSNAPDLQWVRNAGGEPLSSITLYNSSNIPIAQFNQGGFQADNINVNNQIATPVINFENINQTQIVAQIQADSNTNDALTLNGLINPVVQISKYNSPLNLTTFAEFNTSTSQLALHNTSDPISTIFFSASPTGVVTQNLGVSSLTASTIMTDTLIATSTFTSTIFNTYYFSSATVSASSIDCSVIDLDNQFLTATSTTLLLNGVPLATTANLSSIQDWSLFPAVSTINANNNPILNAGNLNIVNNGSYTNTSPQITLNGDVGTGSQPAVISLTNAIGGGQMIISTNQVCINNTDQDNESVQVNAGIDIYDATNANRSVPQAQITLAGDPSGLNNSTIAITAPQGVYIVQTLGNTNVQGTLYTSSIFTSSINGNEFTQSSLTTNNVNAVQLSSIIGNVSLQLVSTLQFSPNINPSLGGVNLGLGSLFSGGIGFASGVIGAAAGTVGMVTGISALAMGRGGSNINNTSFEMINGTSQLQVSTIGSFVSSIYRESSGVPADQVPGSEFFTSTIFSPGMTLMRTYSDPMNTMSSPASTVTAFGPWVELPGVAVVSTFTNLTTQNLNSSTITLGVSTLLRTFSGDATLQVLEAQNVGAFAQIEAQSLTMGGTVGGSNGLLYYQSVPDRPGFIDNANNNFTLAYTSDFAPQLNTSSITNVSSLRFAGVSTIQFATNATLGGQGQPAGRIVMSGSDLDLGQNDLWANQVRVGAGIGVATTNPEVVLYAQNGNTYNLNAGNSDTTIRTYTFASGAGTQGYLLDTTINKPFFSTLTTGGSPTTNLMAFFPSTTNSTIGISTISVMPQLSYYCSALASTTQTVAGANTPTNLNHTHTAVNIGGFTVAGSTITVPVNGTYEIGTSIQFDQTGGGVSLADFWFKKNGADIADSASRITVNGTNGETIGTVSIFDTAVANDQYTICMASPDASMSAAFFQSTVTTPYTRPAIPSIITNIKRLGA